MFSSFFKSCLESCLEPAVDTIVETIVKKKAAERIWEPAVDKIVERSLSDGFYGIINCIMGGGIHKMDLQINRLLHSAI